MEPMAPSAAETHLSWVLFSGTRAIKFLKPVLTDFLDHRDLSARRLACEDEVRLNARMAPDVYEGVASLKLDGEELEPAIVMRRLPADRRLATLVDGPEGRDAVRQVARKVAAFHAGTEVVRGTDARDVAGADAIRARWADDIAGLRVAAEGFGFHEEIAEIERLAAVYLTGRDQLFESRIADGMVRDGHGDLLAEDIFCLDDGPRIIDCLAFDARLRIIDVLADVAFLVMDLQRLGHEDLAVAFLQDYCEFSDEHHPASLAHLFVAQRSLVRAKVDCIRRRQDPTTGAGALGHLIQTLDHLRRAEPRLVLVGGIPGSGKTTLAQGLSDTYGWVVLSSDDLRRDLRLRRDDLPPETGAYTAENAVAVYEALLARGGELLEHGHSVILDASWTSARQRAAARLLADQRSARVLELRCEAPRALCRDRIRERTRSSTTSEATASTVDVLADRLDPWPEALTVDTSGLAERPIPPRSAVPWLRDPTRRPMS